MKNARRGRRNRSRRLLMGSAVVLTLLLLLAAGGVYVTMARPDIGYGLWDMLFGKREPLALTEVDDAAGTTDFRTVSLEAIRQGDEPGFVSTVDRLSFPLDNFASTAIAAAAEELGIRAVRGRIASGDQFVASTERKEEIVRLFSAVTCEMEAGAIAHVCFLNRVPCAVIRCISDGGNEEAPMSYEEFLPLAAKNSAELTLAYLKSLQNL